MTKKLVAVPPADRMAEPHTRRYKVVGEHSARCKREKHEDYMHGMNACAVGASKETHCDCTAHWVEDRDSRLGQ